MLDSERQQLAAKEGELQAQIAALQQTLAEAPRLAAAHAQRERESILNASRGHYRHSTLVDTRHTMEEAPFRGRRAAAPVLRAERRAARRQALTLLVALGAAIAWAVCHFLT